MATIKCNSCGGMVGFDKFTGGYVCAFCGKSYTLNDLQKNNCNDGYGVSTEAADNSVNFSPEELYLRAEVELEAEHWDDVYALCAEMLEKNPRFAKAYLCLLLADCKTYRKEALIFCEEPFDQNKNYRLLLRFADVQLKEEIEGYAQAVNIRYQEINKKKQYDDLCSRMLKTKTEKGFRKLADGFLTLGDYEDSKARYEECLVKLNKARKLEKKEKIKKKFFTAITIICIISIVLGVVLLKSLSYRSELFSVQVTNKINDTYNDNTVFCSFKFEIDNKSSHNVTYMEGVMTIKDADDNVLSSGTAWFNGDINSKNTSYFDLSWNMERTDEAAEIWNTDVSELVVMYRITEIHFDDGKIKEYSVQDIVVNK